MVGTLDPKTGEIKLVTMPTPRSHPYGMVVRSKGVPFFVLVRHQQGREHRSGDDGDQGIPAAERGDASAPHRDHQRRRDLVRGLLARLSRPARSEDRRGQGVGVARAGRSRSRTASPRSNDIIWYSESAVRPNTLVRFDPKTEKFQTWAIPSGGGVVRNMMATRDGDLVLACSGVNRVALVDIK